MILSDFIWLNIEEKLEIIEGERFVLLFFLYQIPKKRPKNSFITPTTMY
jgi:hypothetical protein